MMRAFENMYFLSNNKFGHLSKILSDFGQFYRDLSFIILKSHDHGRQF